MRLVDYLHKGASLGPDAPCLTTDGVSMSYAEVSALAARVAGALAASGVRPGQSVAILSGNDPTAFTCVFGISGAGAVWCPVNPRNEAEENRELLELFDCVALIYQASYAGLVAQVVDRLPRLHTLVRLDGAPEDDGDPAGSDGAHAGGAGGAGVRGALTWGDFLARDGFAAPTDPSVAARAAAPHVAVTDSPGVDAPIGGDGTGRPGGPPVPRDLAMIVGTGGTTGRPKGVMLSARNLETMTALTLMSYPFEGRPRYLALAPLTHAAGVLCFPVLALGGEVVIMRRPDVGAFLRHLAEHRVTHTFLPPTLVYMVLGHPALDTTDLSSLQCFWYGAAPMSATRLEEALTRIGPMAQLFGQTEAPMMIATMSPAEHRRADGSIASERLSSAGRPTPLCTVAVLDEEGRRLAAGENGEICVRGSLVMAGYYKDPEATAEAGRFGWHHTGDIGHLDADGYLHVVDRAKDMIITGGFNVYSAEVEQALLAHPDVQDCGVVGLADDKWGERVVAVVQPHPGRRPDPEEVIAFVKARIGSVKAPKQVLVWPDLPRSKVGKVLKTDIRASLRAG